MLDPNLQLMATNLNLIEACKLKRIFWITLLHIFMQKTYRQKLYISL